MALDPGKSTGQRARKKLSDMRRSAARLLRVSHKNVVYHQCTHFDVQNAIISELKRQPKSNSTENFEEDNEPQLLRVTGKTVIINDK